MSIETKVKLQPFRVPNYVLAETSIKPGRGGYSETIQYRLSQLDAETLDLLCAQFRKDVFEKAGISDPVEMKNPQPIKEEV